MNIIPLSTDLLTGLKDDAPAAAWTARLQEAGLLVEVETPAGDAWSPVAGVQAVQAALGSLQQAEADIDRDRASRPLARLRIPNAIWVVVGMALLVVILFADLLIRAMGPMIIWPGIGFAALVAGWTLLDRGREAGLRGQLEAARNRLHESLSDLLARNFVGRVGPSLMVSTPDLDRARALAEALKLSDPDAPVRAGLEAAIAMVEPRVEALIASPELPWTDRGLSMDLERWEAEIDKLG